MNLSAVAWQDVDWRVLGRATSYCSHHLLSTNSDKQILYVSGDHNNTDYSTFNILT